MKTFDATGDLPTGTSLIEASAGTGKTWTLSALVTRYVAEQGIPLDEILIVTFTRSASQELRERVRESLAGALTALSSDPKPDDDVVVQHLRKASSPELDVRRGRLAQALMNFDGATIATIHQFCQVVLTSLGVAGDSDISARLVEDLSQLEYDVLADTYLAHMREEYPAAQGPLPLSFGDRGWGFNVTRGARSLGQRALDDPSADLSPTQSPNQDLAALMPFLHKARAEYERRKRKAGVLSFNDLLTGVAGALEDETSPAAQRMRERWKVVLVDEFQDTDPVQWDVFRKAFTSDATHALVLIGDPKQAIYGFRGGDINTYLTAAKTAASKVSLPTNYRSDPGLVNGLDVMFSGLRLSEGIVAGAINAHRTQSRLTGVEGHPIQMRYLIDEPTNAGPGVARALCDAAEQIAQLLTSDAQFEGKPLVPGHIAVLCQTNAQLSQMREELHAWNIPAVMASTQSVLHTDAARWWLTLLMAMEQSHRAPLVRAACLTPLIGWTATELDELGEAGTDRAARITGRLNDAFARGGIAAVHDAIKADGLAARLLRHIGGERNVTDVEHVAQLLTTQQIDGATSLTSLIAWLGRGSDDDARVTADARIMRLDSDAQAVTLSTIHGSKGLQFPVVVAPTLWNNYIGDKRAPAVIHRDGKRYLTFDNDEANQPGYVDEALGENMRLVYVAMTRAQSRLMLWWIPTKVSTARSGLHRLLFDPRSPQPDERLRDWKGSGAVNADTVRATMNHWAEQGAFEATEMGAPSRPEWIHLPQSDAPLLARAFDDSAIDREWRRTSYSALASAAENFADAVELSEPEADDVGSLDEMAIEVAPDAPLADSPELQQPSPMADLPMGATFGSLVHAVLEKADFQADDLEAEVGHLIRTELVDWPVADLDTAALTNALVSVLTTPLGDIVSNATLRDMARSDRAPEMEFEVPLAGGDDASTASHSATLRAMAKPLRHYLADEDPLRSYADSLDGEALGSQVLRGYLTGSIDLTFRHDGRYYVADYKTNRLGDFDRPLTLGDYVPATLTEAMNHSSYPLQAILYAVVLHRYLRWRLPGYNAEQHLGGVLYLYVRGMAGPQTPRVDDQPCGVFTWTPPASLVEALSDVLDGTANARGVESDTMPDTIPGAMS